MRVRVRAPQLRGGLREERAQQIQQPAAFRVLMVSQMVG